ncbi:MAG: 3-oxoacid CoA-transferase subunit A [Thermodesulfobacteriota bacterium]|nr:3-oxoacid CoA-transferase subunit A [Thermodesulfobacteriota bacterium]
MPVNKVMESFDEAVEDVCDGAVVLIGGFAGPGSCPTWLIQALARQGAKDLTIVGNSPGFGRRMMSAMRQRRGAADTTPDWFEDGGILAEEGKIKHAICSFPVSSSPAIKTAFEEMLDRGEATVEIVPQGTLAERCRAAKMGIAAFYTPTGSGTVVEKGKEMRKFDDKNYILEHAIKGDFSLIRAYKADRRGNLIYRGTSRTFNAVFAGASTINIAEVDEVVELGELNPEAIVTPGIWVDRVVVRPQEGWVKEVQKW